MKVLAIETSNRPLSVAILEDHHILAETTLTARRKHAQDLLPEIERLMDLVGFTPDQIDRVVVASGPGSYTGLRIGATTAKTWAATMNTELVGISSLANLAGNVTLEGALVAPMFDARNQNVFAGLYRIHNGIPVPEVEDAHTAIADFAQLAAAYNEPIYAIGDAENFKTELEAAWSQVVFGTPAVNLPRAGVLGLLGTQGTPITDVDNFVPRYLRLTQAEAEWREKHPEEETGTYVEKI
ncbi:tRNA (adenosine(37)-N6)-threonylcarbamoyltransferase complex dimerization subunit type 1 TsaB [Levilactobacillus bambusae]|uniref:tRNA (Adenosine(37)-N6)-threonylcarbamoyltransferase complex dimerization subunit type 1 TsaB n=1 Tax=Levilactobacillus bambusae TaxID=2024736 RepID=A0A2V1MXZ0_9LACO|nr:tRNA (adenosine(37)-N6)-threonylcarbamoyltransferase complex dimerization subunit type 1 TsaB [Levilactobacillus bambusae]PWF99397.1 tRNA (adenosine(37)-N6)-threonylcarbamoyltransferase complex dimerization subunit type 1 TsaB [Levilactobacillus bambusae]